MTLKIHHRRTKELILKVEKNSDNIYDLAGAEKDLTNANLTYIDLADAILAYAILARADLTHANLYNDDGSYVDLTGAKLVKADLDGTIQDSDILATIE